MYVFLTLSNSYKLYTPCFADSSVRLPVYKYRFWRIIDLVILCLFTFSSSAGRLLV